MELKASVEAIQPGDSVALLAKLYLFESYFATLCDHHVSNVRQPNETAQSPDPYLSHVLPLLDQLDLLAIECASRKSSDPRTAILIRCLQETRSAFTPHDQVKWPTCGPLSSLSYFFFVSICFQTANFK
jgi:hypothetical protein